MLPGLRGKPERRCFPAPEAVTRPRETAPKPHRTEARHPRRLVCSDPESAGEFSFGTLAGGGVTADGTTRSRAALTPAHHRPPLAPSMSVVPATAATQCRAVSALA